MFAVSDLYQQQLESNLEKSDYIGDFKGNPYSYLKSRYYMFFASIIVYFLQKTSVHPNNITKAYIALGFLSAFLLAYPSSEAHLIALFLIFSKGVLDWTDGHLARIQGRTSLTGHILDIYGARIHSVLFVVSLGFYQYYHFDNNEYFLFALFIYPFCYGTLLTKFSYQYILDDMLNKHEVYEKVELQSSVSSNVKDKYGRVYSFFTWFLDDRSRTIDFVCLLVLMEHYGFYSLSWIFFVGVTLKWMVLWLGSFYVSSKDRVADRTVAENIQQIKNV